MAGAKSVGDLVADDGDERLGVLDAVTGDPEVSGAVEQRPGVAQSKVMEPRVAPW